MHRYGMCWRIQVYPTSTALMVTNYPYYRLYTQMICLDERKWMYHMVLLNNRQRWRRKRQSRRRSTITTTIIIPSDVVRLVIIMKYPSSLVCTAMIAMCFILAQTVFITTDLITITLEGDLVFREIRSFKGFLCMIQTTTIIVRTVPARVVPPVRSWSPLYHWFWRNFHPIITLFI